MTSNQNKILVSQLVITFRLLLLFPTLLILHTLPLALARDATSSSSASDSYNKNGTNLVIMLNGTNVTSISDSFIEFKKMFGVHDDNGTAFTTGDGEYSLHYARFKGGWVINQSTLTGLAHLICINVTTLGLLHHHSPQRQTQ
jgi:hypothetical protein